MLNKIFCIFTISPFNKVSICLSVCLSIYLAGITHVSRLTCFQCGPIHSYDTFLWYMSFMVGETGVPGGNPRRHGENMQTPHRKDLDFVFVFCFWQFKFVMPFLLQQWTVSKTVCAGQEIPLYYSYQYPFREGFQYRGQHCNLPAFLPEAS